MRRGFQPRSQKARQITCIWPNCRSLTSLMTECCVQHARGQIVNLLLGTCHLLLLVHTRSGWQPPKDTGLWDIAAHVRGQIEARTLAAQRLLDCCQKQAKCHITNNACMPSAAALLLRSGWQPPKDTGLWDIAARVRGQIEAQMTPAQQEYWQAEGGYFQQVCLR